MGDGFNQVDFVLIDFNLRDYDEEPNNVKILTLERNICLTKQNTVL